MMIVYTTKASPVIKLLFAAALLVLLAVAGTEKSLALLAVALGFTGFVLYVFYTTHYTVFEQTLTIKSGFIFSESIDIDRIRKVTKARKNLLSGPGFSVNRLVIEYNEKDCVVISPHQQQAFLNHLKRINPDILLIE